MKNFYDAFNAIYLHWRIYFSLYKRGKLCHEKQLKEINVIIKNEFKIQNITHGKLSYFACAIIIVAALKHIHMRNIIRCDLNCEIIVIGLWMNCDFFVAMSLNSLQIPAK